MEVKNLMVVKVVSWLICKEKALIDLEPAKKFLKVNTSLFCRHCRISSVMFCVSAFMYSSNHLFPP